MQNKIRNAQLKKIPYMLIVDDKEEQEDKVSVRLRSGIDLRSMSIQTIIDRIKMEIEARHDSQEDVAR